MLRRFRVTPLGNLGGSATFALAINNNGQATGYSNLAGDQAYHAFLYNPGKMTDLGTLGGANSRGVAINNKGHVVGSSDVQGSLDHGVLYKDGMAIDLGVDKIPSGINDNGQMTGPGALSPLPNLVGQGINNQGQVTGVTRGTPPSQAFLYTNGVTRELGTLGFTSQGVGINDKGQVVGSSFASFPAPEYPVLFSDGTVNSLGSLGGTRGFARAINNCGEVTGYSFTLENSTEHAFLYSFGQLFDLNDLIDPSLGITFEDGTGINDASQIVANATDGNAYLLTPER